MKDIALLTEIRDLLAAQNADLWDTKQMCEYFRCGSTKLYEILAQPGAPKSIKLYQGKRGSNPLWVALDVKQWALSKREVA